MLIEKCPQSLKECNGEMAGIRALVDATLASGASFLRFQ